MASLRSTDYHPAPAPQGALEKERRRRKRWTYQEERCSGAGGSSGEVRGRSYDLPRKKAGILLLLAIYGKRKIVKNSANPAPLVGGSQGIFHGSLTTVGEEATAFVLDLWRDKMEAAAVERGQEGGNTMGMERGKRL